MEQLLKEIARNVKAQIILVSTINSGEDGLKDNGVQQRQKDRQEDPREGGITRYVMKCTKGGSTKLQIIEKYGTGQNSKSIKEAHRFLIVYSNTDCIISVKCKLTKYKIY